MAKQQKQVYYVTTKPKIYNFFQGKIDVDEEVMRYIQLKYTEDSHSLISFFANIHLLDELPQLVIVDNLSIVGTDRATLFKTLALIKEAHVYLNNAITPQQDQWKCPVLIGDFIDQETSGKRLDFFTPWIPLTLLLSGQHNPFGLSVSNCPIPYPSKPLFNFNFVGKEMNLVSVEYTEEGSRRYIS